MYQKKSLSREEVTELFKRIEAGDEKAREDLLKAYRGLVEEVVSKYQMHEVDLIQEGLKSHFPLATLPFCPLAILL